VADAEVRAGVADAEARAGVAARGRRSPLHGWAGIDVPGLRVVEVPFRTQIDVRAARLDVPDAPGTRVLRLGPDEWLVTTDPDAPAMSTVDEALSVVDVSAQWTTVLVEGEHGRDLLAHGCPLDLHPGVFPVGACAQSTLARAQVVLVRVAEQGFWVLVRASSARYLAGWLEDAAVEYVAA
jgi:sarcosine oxidase subunit gamma